MRLRHQLGLRSKFGRGRLSWLETEVVRQLENLEEAGESIEFEPLDPDEEAAILAAVEEERRWNEEAFLDSLSNEEVAEYFEALELDAARKAAQERLGRGAKGMSERSRREMWRWVLSLPFDLLGDRPLWITLTYPGDWRRWVPDGRTLERHRRAFGEAWYRGFGERPIGFWSKEFQLAEGRFHLHLLMKGPESMSEADYRGFQMLTRLGNSNVRKHGKHDGRWWTPPISQLFGGETATELLRWWSQIVTDGTVENHARRGVNVRTVFYAKDNAVATDMRRSAIAAYMAGEAAKARQKVPPDGFGTVGRYFGTFGYQVGFKPTVELLEVDEDVWYQLNRRLTLLDAWKGFTAVVARTSDSSATSTSSDGDERVRPGLLVQRLWGQVFAVRPGDGPSFRVHPNTGEVLWVAEWFEDASPLLGRQIHVSHCPVAEQQPEDMVADHRCSHDDR